MTDLEVARTNLLGYRTGVQDLTRPVGAVLSCQVLGIGLQDTPPGSALLGLAHRTGQPAKKLSGLGTADGPLVVVMGVRGAPHLIARSELPLLAAAVYPTDESQAAEVDEVAGAMRDVAVGAMSRPALSAAINDRVADSLRVCCDRCRSRHVREGLFRPATVQAGLELDPQAATAVFLPSPAGPPVADRVSARVELARRYVHLCGVARPTDLASWFGRTPTENSATWARLADLLTPCLVEGRKRWALAADLPALSQATVAEGVHLLPPADPYLLGDRALVLPERDDSRQVWRPVGSPGAVLVDGDIVGTWRQRLNGGHLQVTVLPFRRLDPAAERALIEAAGKVAVLRGATKATVNLATSARAGQRLR